MSTISRFVKFVPALILVFLVGCSTMAPHEKQDKAMEKKVPPKIALPADTKETAEGAKASREEALISEDMTNQDMLDSALEFIQESTEYWEQGDLEHAVDSLDSAYALILEVEADDDPDLIQQVLLNLVTNALDATPEGGQVQLSASADASRYTWQLPA